MTSEEIKAAYSMREIVERYGLRPNRASFISCPFHSGDHTPSMKIYPRDYHCHACGANGDIFSFVQQMDGLSFKEAFISLGGDYDEYKDAKSSFSARRKIRERENQRKTAEKRTERLKSKRNNLNRELTRLNDIIAQNVPYIDAEGEPVFPEAWCEAKHKIEYIFYVISCLNEQIDGR